MFAAIESMRAGFALISALELPAHLDVAGRAAVRHVVDLVGRNLMGHNVYTDIAANAAGQT